MVYENNEVNIHFEYSYCLFHMPCARASGQKLGLSGERFSGQKGLLHSHKDLGSDPSAHLKKPGMIGSTCSPSTHKRDEEQEDHWGL